jgi:hypothetical protein
LLRKQVEEATITKKQATNARVREAEVHEEASRLQEELSTYFAKVLTRLRILRSPTSQAS